MRALSVDHVLEIVHRHNPLHAIFVTDSALAAATLAVLLVMACWFAATDQAYYRRRRQEHRIVVLAMTIASAIACVAGRSFLNVDERFKVQGAVIAGCTAVLTIIGAIRCHIRRPDKPYSQLQLWALLTLASIEATLTVAIVDSLTTNPNSHLSIWGVSHELLWLVDLGLLIGLAAVSGSFVHRTIED